jgi:hypothetical protein
MESVLFERREASDNFPQCRWPLGSGYHGRRVQVRIFSANGGLCGYRGQEAKKRAARSSS